MILEFSLGIDSGKHSVVFKIFRQYKKVAIISKKNGLILVVELKTARRRIMKIIHQQNFCDEIFCLSHQKY